MENSTRWLWRRASQTCHLWLPGFRSPIPASLCCPIAQHHAMLSQCPPVCCYVSWRWLPLTRPISLLQLFRLRSIVNVTNKNGIQLSIAIEENFPHLRPSPGCSSCWRRLPKTCGCVAWWWVSNRCGSYVLGVHIGGHCSVGIFRQKHSCVFSAEFLQSIVKWSTLGSWTFLCPIISRTQTTNRYPIT